MVTGVAAVPATLLVGAGIGFIQGGLLPGACQGLACLYPAIVALGAAAVAALWLVLGTVRAMTRRRRPNSTVRLRTLQVAAVVSWGPVLWLVVVAVE